MGEVRLAKRAAALHDVGDVVVEEELAQGHGVSSAGAAGGGTQPPIARSSSSATATAT